MSARAQGMYQHLRVVQPLSKSLEYLGVAVIVAIKSRGVHKVDVGLGERWFIDRDIVGT